MFYLVCLGAVLAAMGAPQLDQLMNRIIRGMVIAVALLVYGVWYYSNYAIDQIRCMAGNETICSEYVKYVPDNIPQAMLDEWNKDKNIHPGSEFSPWHLPRWSLAKTVWYDGEFVKVHRLCVGMDYPEYDGWEADQACKDPVVMSGKHAGITMPHKTSYYAAGFDQLWDASPGYIGFNGIINRHHPH